MKKNLEITEILEKYICDLSEELHPVQKEIIKFNNSLGEIKKMQISEIQSFFLQAFIRSSNIKKILEIGSFTGFSALSMALALPKDGILISLDKDEEKSKIAKSFYNKSNLKKINQIIKPALESINELKKKNNKFDLVFIDADKENYKLYYNNALEMINKNGTIIIDNVLWHGEVVDKTNKKKLTEVIREFNSYVKKDKRVVNYILPIGDGFTICIKK